MKKLKVFSISAIFIAICCSLFFSASVFAASKYRDKFNRKPSGNIYYYDENGHKEGISRPGAFGGTVYYDENGKKVGTSRPGALGGTVYYDEKGNKTGTSRPGTFGGTIFYDENGKRRK